MSLQSAGIHQLRPRINANRKIRNPGYPQESFASANSICAPCLHSNSHNPNSLRLL